jgi:acyl-CoA thioesterase 8
MHCYFVLAGDATIPVLYHVEHVREGRSFATRTVQARQRGKCIFTTTMSFIREGTAGKQKVEHATPMPSDILKPEDGAESVGEDSRLNVFESPFESRRVEMTGEGEGPHAKKTRQWMRARGRISPAGGHQAHLSALAYMSDSYFIGTVSRVHNLWRFSSSSQLPKGVDPTDPAVQEALREAKKAEGFGHDLENRANRPSIGMMVSLDHTIYFHEPRAFRADEWIFTEMESPWSGDGRGLVLQKMWSKDGRLIATCVQEVSDICSTNRRANVLITSTGCCEAQAGSRASSETMRGCFR